MGPPLNTWLWRRNLADSSVVDRAGPAAIAAEPTANGTPAAPPQSDAIAALLDLDLDATAPAEQVIYLNPDIYPDLASPVQALDMDACRHLASVYMGWSWRDGTFHPDCAIQSSAVDRLRTEELQAVQGFAMAEALGWTCVEDSRS